jgi:hypothetical protein
MATARQSNDEIADDVKSIEKPSRRADASLDFKRDE